LSRGCCIGAFDEVVEEGGSFGLIVFTGVLALAEEDRDELAAGLEVGAGFADGLHARRRQVPLVRVPRTLPKILSPEQVQAVLGALGSKRDRAMVLAMVLGGLRRCEVLGLRLGDIRVSERSLPDVIWDTLRFACHGRWEPARLPAAPPASASLTRLR
jgi:hypothetical protein